MLDEDVQQALDAIRFHGNEGVHAAELQILDNEGTVEYLFQLCNLLVEELISRKARIEAFYDCMPDSYKDAIDKRDNK